MRNKQLLLPCKGKGGWRPNAGRPRGDGVSHHGREEIQSRFPVHLVWRTAEGVPSLRLNRVYPRVIAAIRKYSSRDSFRIVYGCVLGNHLHVVGECNSEQGLGRAMLALGTSIAMRINRATGHRGPVFAERYFVRQLRTPTEVARAVADVLENEKHHGFEQREPLILATPGTWLLREGWMRARLRPRRLTVSGPPSTDQDSDVAGIRT